jgi:hypothetical protein
VRSNGSRAVHAARRLDAGGIVLFLAFVAVCAAAVLAEGRIFRFFFAITAACGLAVAAILQVRERLSGWLVGAEIKDDLRHPAIARHRVRDVGGFILVAASVAAVVAGIPTVWCFFAIAIGAGIAVAVVMHWAHGSA